PMRNRLLARCCQVLLVAFCGYSAGCSGPDQKQDEDPRRPAFAPIVDVDFYEVRRSFDNGLAYDSIGFVQEAEWHIKFTREDAVQIYVPGSDSSFNFQITHDHDSFFHFARESWKVVDLHPDSIMLQRLSLRHLTVDKVRSNVYMRFYSDAYVRNRLKTSIQELRKPRPQDSLFVRRQVAKANRNPYNPDIAFSSMLVVRLVSNMRILVIYRLVVDSLEFMVRSSVSNYLYPEYDIETI